MKKYKYRSCFLLILVALMAFSCFSLAACGNKSGKDEVDLKNSKVLVVYFSATGNTQQVANYIKDILNATTYEIVPTVEYSSNDLNWNNSNSRVNLEHNAYVNNDKSSEYYRPSFVRQGANFSEYDVIFIGYPIWWGEAPNIIYTFLDEYASELGDKTIVPFCTSSSSGMGQSATHLHSLISKNANWLDGQRFSSGTSKKAVEEWINKINVTNQ